MVRSPSLLVSLSASLVLATVPAACDRKAAPPAGDPAPTRAPAPAPAPPAVPAPAPITATVDAAAAPTFSLPALRKALKTTIRGASNRTAPDAPPPKVFQLVKYRAPLGDNVAYVTPPADGARRPAIIWIAGGFDWSIDAGAWQPGPRSNDQSAHVFNQPGLVVMRPALRGASGNPGVNECLLGEVDDVLAAAEYLASRPDVDPARIYLGGHSTGGTMALLAAASTDRFRAVFAFGPIHDTRAYQACLPMDATGDEARLRAPIEFMAEIVTPTFVIEGDGGNHGVLPLLKAKAGGAPVTFTVVPGADHFSVLRPGSEVIARAILADTGPKPAITIDAETIQKALTTP